MSVSPRQIGICREEYYMVEISFLSAELIFTAIWLLARIIVWKQQGQIQWKREAVLLLMYINLAVIIRFVLFPRDLVNGHVQPLVFEAAAVFPFCDNPCDILRPYLRDRYRKQKQTTSNI